MTGFERVHIKRPRRIYVGFMRQRMLRVIADQNILGGSLWLSGRSNQVDMPNLPL